MEMYEEFNAAHVIGRHDVDPDYCPCGFSWGLDALYDNEDELSGFRTYIEYYKCQQCGLIVIVEQYRVPIFVSNENVLEV